MTRNVLWSRSRQLGKRWRSRGWCHDPGPQSPDPNPKPPTPPPPPPNPTSPTPAPQLKPPDPKPPTSTSRPQPPDPNCPELHLFQTRLPHYTRFASNRLRVKSSSRQVCLGQIVCVKLSCFDRCLNPAHCNSCPCVLDRKILCTCLVSQCPHSFD